MNFAPIIHCLAWTIPPPPNIREKQLLCIVYIKTCLSSSVSTINSIQIYFAYIKELRYSVIEQMISRNPYFYFKLWFYILNCAWIIFILFGVISESWWRLKQAILAFPSRYFVSWSPHAHNSKSIVWFKMSKNYCHCHEPWCWQHVWGLCLNLPPIKQSPNQCKHLFLPSLVSIDFFKQGLEKVKE